jgi:aspartyl/asparaginyl-tRNA synthetase
VTVSADNYGDMPTVQSQSVSGQTWTPVLTLTKELAGNEVLIRGRVHTVRAKGKSAFLVVREGGATVQVVFFVDEKVVSKQMVKYISGLSKESIVDVVGTVSVPPEKLESTTQQVSSR